MVALVVNGEQCEAPASDRNLLSYLRFDLGLTGSKYGCGEGLCGACTVLVDGQPLRACTATVGAVAGGQLVLLKVDMAGIPHQAFAELTGSDPLSSLIVYATLK